MNQEEYNFQCEIEYLKCHSKRELRKFINKYGQDTNNKFVKLAKEQLNKNKINIISNNNYYQNSDEGENILRDIKQNMNTKNVIKGICFIAGCAIFAIGFLFIKNYLHDKAYKSEENIINPINPEPRPINPDPSPVYPEPEPTPSPYEDEYPEPEPMPEPAKKFKQCDFCFHGYCGVCGGTGQVYSVFDGEEVVPGRMTDCKNCEGSGECPMCKGSGWIEDFDFSW